MPQQFDRNSTTNEVLEGVDLTGKRVFITGVSAGLGLETARAIVARGAHVIGTVRDFDKAKRAWEPVAPNGAGSIEFVQLDLESLASVRACADALVARGEKLDVIIANAGIMACPFAKTQDGFERQFGTNHLGHFVLVNRLVPLLERGARVVVLASSGHRISDVDLDDPNFEKTPYNPITSYGRAKTANVLFAVELDRRYAPRGIRAIALHPGGIRTELMRHMDQATVQQLIESSQRIAQESGVALQGLKTVEQGAATSVWAAFVANPADVGGRYCTDCQIGQIADANGKGDTARYAIDPARAKALWAKSEELVGEKFPE